MGANLSRTLRRILSGFENGNPPIPEQELKVFQEWDPNLDRLDLRNLNLKQIPDQVYELENLTWIQFSQNQIEFLSPEIKRLKKLKMIRLFSNCIETLPPEIGELTELTTLDAGKNLLVVLCPEIGKCLSLTEINLQWNKITEIPPELGQLRNLRVLNLYINRLTSLPDSVGELRSLEVLDLAHNRIKVLPSVLGSFENLTTLNLVGNGFRQLPEEIGNLRSLRKLDIRCNYVQKFPDGLCNLPIRTLLARNNLLMELPENFGNLTQLSECRIDTNRLRSLPSSIGDCQELKLLFAFDNQLVRVEDSLGNISGLVELDLSSNLLHDLPDSLEGLRSLEGLFLTKNAFETLPSCLSAMSSLTDLELLENQIAHLNGEIFPPLTRLGKLNISKNLVRELPLEMMQLKSLMFLELCWNELQTIPVEIHHLESLTFLNLAFNRLEELPESLSVMKDLQKLYLSGNPSLKDFDWPQSYSQMSLLEEFVCSGSALEEIPSFLYSLPQLKYLDLSNNQFQGPIPSEIGTLTELTCLVLSGNAFESIPREISSLTHLVDLDLSLNRLDSIPEEIQQLGCLVDLDLSGNALEQIPNLRRLNALLQLKIAHNQINTPPKIDSTQGCWISKEGNEALNRGSNGSNSSGKKSGRALEKYLPDYESLFRLKPGKRALPGSIFLALQQTPPSRWNFTFGWSELRGRRPDQQDTVSIVHHPFGVPSHWVGLFDGHGGVVSAELSASVLHRVFFERLAHQDSSSSSIEEVFVESFHQMQAELVAHQVQDGTAVNVVFLVGNHIYVANAGDSRCVLVRKQNHSDSLYPVALSSDHKPESQEERDRIEAQYGFVTESKRVNGILALSRALGDCDLQPPVTCEPAITKTEITSQDRYVILGCDGLWDVMSNEQAVYLIRDVPDAKSAALILRDCAYCLGSTDNISVVVIGIHS